MTEEEWLKATDPTPMLEFLRGKVSDRKLRLFAVACCLPIRCLLTDELNSQAIDISERYADGMVTGNEVASVRREFRAAYRNNHRENLAKNISEHHASRWALGWDMSQYTLRTKSYDAARLVIVGFDVGCRTGLVPADQRNLAVILLRDVFNPFRSTAFTPSWRTSTVLALANGIYKEKAFDRLPILADALQDAGCDSEELLNHLRRGGEHCRGCWALDLVLAKE